MARIKWDETGDRMFELGVKNGVLYPQSSGVYPNGVAWNGLTSVNESPSGAEANDMYADDIKYGSIRSAETFGGTIEAYTYPDEFMKCDGSEQPTTGVTIGQQKRIPFGLCYRTQIGNDTSDDIGYKLHLVYGATASPSEKAYQTINDSPEAITFSWEFETSPVNVTNYKPTSVITIDSTKMESSSQQAALLELEDILYGTDGSAGVEPTEPRLPLPDEVISIMDVSPEPIGLSVIAMDSDDTFEDVTISDLQENIIVNLSEGISGTLKYYTAESGSSWSLGNGNFLALQFETDADSIKAGIDSELIAIGTNMNGVWKVTDEDTQKFNVIVTKGTATESYTYDLSGLTLNTSY